MHACLSTTVLVLMDLDFDLPFMTRKGDFTASGSYGKTMLACSIHRRVTLPANEHVSRLNRLLGIITDGRSLRVKPMEKQASFHVIERPRFS